MSEYQSYAFLAMDRPLSAADQRALRAITSRATITDTTLQNDYHYGDFKGDPKALLHKYFDVHVYVASWGTHRLMVRVPRKQVDPAQLRPYCQGNGLKLLTAPTHLILDFEHATDEADWDEEDSGHWLRHLANVRAAILEGDLRPLYLGWLGGLNHMNTFEEDLEKPEPPVPEDLSKLPAPLKALANFLRIDPTLITAAAQASKAPPETSHNLRDFIKNLPIPQKDAILLELAEGTAASARARLLADFRASIPKSPPTASRRTGQDLLDAAEALADQKSAQRAARAAHAQDRRAQQEEAALQERLKKLRKKGAAIWGQLDRLANTKDPAAYDEVTAHLVDLYALARQEQRVPEFRERLMTFRKEHPQPALLRRLGEAGLKAWDIPR